MTELLPPWSSWVIALPIGAFLGWIGNKLFAPTFEALGTALLDRLTQFAKREQIARSAYLELERLIRENHSINGHNPFSSRKTYFRDRDIDAFFAKHGSFMRRAIKRVWIDESDINTYAESDIFFAGMELLIMELGKKDLQKIFEKNRNNDQAGLWPFLEVIEEKKSKLLSSEMISYLREQQRKWNDAQNQERTT